MGNVNIFHDETVLIYWKEWSARVPNA